MSLEIFSKRNRVLIYQLVKTDFKLRYQGSFIGLLWSVLKPLMMFAVMYIVFVQALKFSDGTSTYPIILLLGISLWQFFTEATGIGMQSVVARGDIIRKITFPKYIIVVSSMVSALINLLINLLVIVFFALISGVTFTWNILFVPFSLLQLFMLAFGVALFLSAFYVKFRDISHIYDVAMQAIFYSIPIIYPFSLLASKEILGISIQKLSLLNPITQTNQDIRYSLIAPTSTTTIWNSVNTWWIAIIPVVATIIIFIIGVVYFSKNSKYFAEKI